MQNNINKFILLIVYGPIENDARVIRSAESIYDLSEKVVVVSYNSDLNYVNNKFKSIVFTGNKNKLSLLSFWCKVFKYTYINRESIRLIYLHDYYMCGIGRILSKVVKVKWIYDAHELLIDRKSINQNFRSRLFSFLEKINVNNASLVVSANYERERIIKYVYNLSNTINILNIAPKKELSNIDTFKNDTLVYQGYLSKGRGLEEYIKLLQYLPKKYKLKIIGSGPDYEYFKDKVNEMFLNDRVSFTGKIPYDQLIKENENCIIGIVSYSLNGLNNYYCSPNKLYEYAQLNMPMIFSSQPFLVKISRKYRIGEVFYENMSYERRSEIILEMIDNLGYYQKNMNMFLIDYSFDNEMSKLKNAIKDLLNNNSN